MDNTKKILVLGGTGKTGGRVVEQLTQRGLPIRIGSRSGEPKFDWLDQSTWQPVLQDIHAVYITYQPDLAVPEAVAAIRSLTEMAVKSGIRKLVLLSGRGEEAAQQCEQIVMNAGIGWTIVRASWFSQNFSEGYLLDPVRGGYVALPAGDVGEPFIDADDIADVAVAALTDDKHVGQLYELTGPRVLSFKEAIGEIAHATGRPIQFEQITVDEFTTALTDQEVPKEYIWLLGYLFTEVSGRNASLADGVQRALNRQPKDFTTYVQETAAKGVWNT